jgi:hypothetical protein
MNIFLSWLTTEGNYSQYKGGDGNKGETKIAIAKELSLKIVHSSCIVERDPKQIANKINKLVWQYRDAIAFKNSTGQQHLSEDDMENAVFGICKYFNELDPILCDCPSTTALLTNKEAFYMEDNDDDISITSDGNISRPSIAASSPESRNATEKAEKRMASLRNTKNSSSTTKSSANMNLSEERKSLVPKKRRRKEDSEGKTLLKLMKAMMTKYKCEEKKVKCEEERLALERQKIVMEAQQRSLQMHFELFSYCQQLKNIGISEDDINMHFPIPGGEIGAIDGIVTEQVTPGSTRLNLTDDINLQAMDFDDCFEGDTLEETDDSDSSCQS